jgi:hypothetical protein
MEKVTRMQAIWVGDRKQQKLLEFTLIMMKAKNVYLYERLIRKIKNLIVHNGD